MPIIVQLLASDRELTAHATIFSDVNLCADDELSRWLPRSERYQSGRVVDRQGNHAIIETDGQRFSLHRRPNRLGWSISDGEH
jgi:hypothetical protein